jgi:hypothetical protein
MRAPSLTATQRVHPCEETPSTTHADDDAPRSPPTPTRRNNRRSYGAEREQSSRLPHVFLLKNLEPVTPSRTCNAWYPHRIHPLTTASISPSPFDREPRHCPFSIALAPSQGRSYLAPYQTSISPPFPLGLSVPYSPKQDHPAFWQEISLASFPISPQLRPVRTRAFLFSADSCTFVCLFRTSSPWNLQHPDPMVPSLHDPSTPKIAPRNAYPPSCPTSERVCVVYWYSIQ